MNLEDKREVRQQFYDQVTDYCIKEYFHKAYADHVHVATKIAFIAGQNPNIEDFRMTIENASEKLMELVLYSRWVGETDWIAVDVTITPTSVEDMSDEG